MSTYDDAAHLPASIDSVLAQDFTDFEFIIVNDGSPDPRTGEILADYAKRDERIRIITKENEGLTKALIDGCAAARGQYIARIDVGDVMLPPRLGRQVAVLDTHPGVVFVSCWTEYCAPEWEYLSVVTGGKTPEEGMEILPTVPGDALIAGPSCHPSVTMRRSTYQAAGGYRWQFYYGQDWDLWYRLAERGKFVMIPEVLYRVRVFPGGLSGRHRAMQRAVGKWAREAFRRRLLGLEESDCLEQAAKIRPGCQLSRKRKTSPAQGWCFVGEQLRRNNNARCRYYLREAIRRDPLYCRAWLRLIQAAFIIGEPMVSRIGMEVPR